MDEDDISRTIEEELREHESKGHIRRLGWAEMLEKVKGRRNCLLYTSPSPRD